MKKYRYYFVDINLTIFANSGDECEKVYNMMYSEPYEGVIELTNMETGYTNKMLPIKGLN